MKKIPGRIIAKKLLMQIAERVSRLSDPPGLAVVLIGDDPASHLYVKIKERACRQVGIIFVKKVFPASARQDEVLETIQRLNHRPDIHGIIVQLPLPEHLDENTIISSIKPQKDVDGYHPETIRKLLAGQQTYIPALAQSILLLIESTGESINGKKVTVIAKSQEFYAPLEYLIRQRRGSIELCRPADIHKKAQTADIIIIAVGQPASLTAADIKPGAIIIDVGITRLPSGVVGDVAGKTLDRVPGFITPVPGGVGPVTVATLLANTVQAAAK